MENKYYTPKIEEFHVGFIFELKLCDGSWKKREFTNCTFENMIDTNDGGERPFEAGLYWIHNEAPLIRVKYLDREDIESLGWIHEEDNLFTFKSGDITYYLILYPKFDNKIEIRCTHPSVTYGNFLGNCKNKSEFKRVMEQLRITNE